MAASVTKNLKIHETTSPSGEFVAVFLQRDDHGLSLIDGRATMRLPTGALPAVMARFGAPLDPDERLAPVAAFDLGGGARLSHVRHLSRFDVIARDYLVYEASGQEPRCALATTVAGALAHLAAAVLAK